MVDCYSALIELERPEFVKHAIERIDFHADQHSAIARPQDQTACCFILTLPADDLELATQCARNLVDMVGFPLVGFEILTSDELDRRLPS